MSKRQMKKGNVTAARPSLLKRDDEYNASLDALMAEIKKISVATEEIKTSQEKTGKVLVRHEETLGDHEKRLAALEGACNEPQPKPQIQPTKDVDPQPKPQVQPTKDVDPQPKPQVQPTKDVEPQPKPQVQPEKTVDPRPDPVSRSACAGFTGKALVFFIHDADGRIDYSRPFYSPNVAKLYDWRYAIVPSWVENGVYVRPLTSDEASGVVW